MDERYHLLFGIGQHLALAMLIGIGECFLKRGLGNNKTLNANEQASVVHRREHAGEPIVFFAEKPADCAKIAPLCGTVAINHGAGRRNFDAKLFLYTEAEHVIAGARRSIFVEQEFASLRKNFGTKNSDIERVLAVESGNRANTRWTILSVRSCSP